MQVRRWWLVALAGLLVVATACGSSGSSKGASSNGTTPGTGGSTAAVVTDKSLGTGVTADTIRLGILMLDYDCIAQYVDAIRPDQQQAFQIFVDQINEKPIFGRKIVPVFKKYCPIDNTGELSACTSFTEDENVFAVVGTFYDPSGDAQLCFTKRHKTPIVADSITEALVKQAPAGMMVSPDIAPERRLRVIMSLLKSQGTLNGKTVAVVSDGPNKARVKSDVSAPLQAMGVKRGTDATLDVSKDTTTALTQLQSYIERWKGDGTNAVVLVGQDVSSNQFVDKIKQAFPQMLLIADTTSILDDARTEQKQHVSPNPYDGAITAEGQTGVEHTKTPHFTFCRDIWEKATGKKVPSPNTVVKLPNGKQNDIYGEVEDACLFTNFFATIARRVGPYLNVTNWTNTVNNFGAIDDTSTIYASIHQGKYDADDTYGLVAVDPTIGADGDWRHVTPVQHVTGS